jgi:uncharacterized protein YciI
MMLGITVLALGLLSTPAEEMTTYHVVSLRPNPARTALAKEEGAKLQAAHMAHIQSMARRGKLVAAGPFGDRPVTISGIFVFETPTMEEARREAEADPTVVAKRNLVEILSWRAPKGLGAEYRRLHAADPKTPEGMGMHPLVFLRKGAGWDAAARERHERYVGQLRAQGKLAGAGAAESEDGIVSLVVFDRIEYEEAERLVASDPAVESGALKPEVHRWWCSAHVLPWGSAR